MSVAKVAPKDTKVSGVESFPTETEVAKESFASEFQDGKYLGFGTPEAGSISKLILKKDGGSGIPVLSTILKLFSDDEHFSITDSNGEAVGAIGQKGSVLGKRITLLDKEGKIICIVKKPFTPNVTHFDMMGPEPLLEGDTAAETVDGVAFYNWYKFIDTAEGTVPRTLNIWRGNAFYGHSIFNRTAEKKTDIMLTGVNENFKETYACFHKQDASSWEVTIGPGMDIAAGLISAVALHELIGLFSQ